MGEVHALANGNTSFSAIVLDSRGSMCINTNNQNSVLGNKGLLGKKGWFVSTGLPYRRLPMKQSEAKLTLGDATPGKQEKRKKGKSCGDGEKVNSGYCFIKLAPRKPSRLYSLLFIYFF